MKNDNKTDNSGGKDSAKGKVLIFALGVLLGAIISISAFVIGINMADNQQSNPRSSSIQHNLPSGRSNNQKKSQRQLPEGQNDTKQNAPTEQPNQNGDSRPETSNNSSQNQKNRKN